MAAYRAFLHSFRLGMVGGVLSLLLLHPPTRPWAGHLLLVVLVILFLLWVMEGDVT